MFAIVFKKYKNSSYSMIKTKNNLILSITYKLGILMRFAN